MRGIASAGYIPIYPFPRDISVPKNELIVFKERAETPVRDKQGESILNKEGSPKYRKVKNITKYLRWDGTILVEVK